MKPQLYKIYYSGSVERYQNRFWIEHANDERQAVRQLYQSIRDKDFFIDQSDRVTDCDGNIIQDVNEKTIYYENGYFIAEKLFHASKH
ncbi:hypothetical protein EBZ39_10890 [bacterium]|nr:hypothetical protein [bacterium]